MDLKQFFSLPDAPSQKEIAIAIGLKSATQLRHWIAKYEGRRPGPGYAAKLEEATGKKVTRQELRPDDWHVVWPELLQKTKQEN